MKTFTMRTFALAAGLAAAMDFEAQLSKFKGMYDSGLLSEDGYKELEREVIAGMKAAMKAAPKENEQAPRRMLQDNSDVAQSKCLASMMADTADMAQECMDGIRTATNPAVTGIIQFLADNLEIPACPECPSMVMSGDGAFPPCGALPVRYDTMPITHNCPTEYPFMKAGSGCNAQCTNGPERFDFYCPPDNNDPMSAPRAVVPQWAVDEGFDAWMPRCCEAQPNCANPHEGYKCASDIIDLVMCFEGRPGYFVQENFVVNACADVCVTCWGSSDKRCLECYDGYFYDTDIINFPQTSQYLHESEEGDYTYATCTRCDDSCHTCDGPGPENCLHRVCHDDYCQGENMVLVEGWEEIMCHRDDCELLQNGRRAMVQQNGRRSLQSGEDVCCVEREPCNMNACFQPNYELWRDGSAENLLCAGPECNPSDDNETCCELAFEQCNENACQNLWYLREDYDQRFCSGWPCDKNVDYDNENCCYHAAWLDYSSENIRKEGKTMRMQADDWDGARMSEWYTTGTWSNTVLFDYSSASGTANMYGLCRRFGTGWWSHFDSGNPNDGHPDGYGFYSDSGPYAWYGGASWHHVDGCCHGWTNGDYVRVELNVDERWVKWYLTRPGDESLRDRQWGMGTNLDCAYGCSFCLTAHNNGQRMTIIDDFMFKQTGNPDDYRSYQVFDNNLSEQMEWRNYDGHLLDWGGDDAHQPRVEYECAARGDGHIFTDPADGSDLNCADRKTVTHWHHGRWWSWRASMWKKTGFASITYNMNYYYQYMMMSVLRGDYVRYYNHPHSGGVGDEHPDGWTWFSSNYSYDNYVPYGGNFYHDRSDIQHWQTDDQLRIDYDLRNGERQIQFFINSPSRGYDWVAVCRHRDFDIGQNGIAFGGASHDGSNSGVGNSVTIMDIYWHESMSYDEMIASGEDLSGSPGSGQPEGRRLAEGESGERDFSAARRKRWAAIKNKTAKRL